MSICSNRAGIALVSALSLLALLGLLLTGAVAVATTAQHAARVSLPEGVLLGAADYAIGEVLADPVPFGLADLPFGMAREEDVRVPGVSFIRSSVRATRLPNGVYWLVGEATTLNADSARRSVGVVARTAWLGPVPIAPLIARGMTTLAPDVIVLNDTLGDPDCAVNTVPAPLQTDDSATVFEGPGQWSAVSSAPGVRLVRGDTTISSGSFEGILIVDGQLTIDGVVDLQGLVIARGPIRSPIGLHLTGAMVSQASGSAAIDLHGATLRFSPCLVHRLLRRASPIRAARAGGWVELF
jgi:hypothetical protein